MLVGLALSCPLSTEAGICTAVHIKLIKLIITGPETRDGKKGKDAIGCFTPKKYH